MSQSEKVLSHPANSSVYLSLLVNGSCMDLFLFSHRKHQSSPDLEMYYLTAETKCYLTAAVTSPHFESLKSLTKPLAHGITDGSLSHGEHSTQNRDPIFTALSGTENTILAGTFSGWNVRGCTSEGQGSSQRSCIARGGMPWAGLLQAERAGAGTRGWQGCSSISSEVFPPALAAWSRLSTGDKQGIPALTNPPLSPGKLQRSLAMLQGRQEVWM